MARRLRTLPKGVERRAVLTTSGIILAGDSENRPGDPIIGPDNKVHEIERVLPRHARETDYLSQPQTLW